MDKVAILGASGFIGSRAVEMLYLNQLAEVRPIVRGFNSLARLARFDLESSIASAVDPVALQSAFRGCDFVVHTLVGDTQTIIDSVVATYKAAQAAEVKRIVYLSSMVVHGFAPGQGCDENSLLIRQQPYPYGRAKVIAEERLTRLGHDRGPEIVILRPGIVYGPRSNSWTAGIADELLRRQAYLANNGYGICNVAYVDNVVQAIWSSLTAESSSVDGEAFLIVDDDLITWYDFYKSIADALAIDMESVYRVTPEEEVRTLTRTWRDTANDWRAMPVVQKILPVVPGELKMAVKKMIFGQPRPSRQMTDAAPLKPALQPERVTAQLCQFKLSNAKAKSTFGYAPISFSDGSKKATGWLSFAGYPVVGG